MDVDELKTAIRDCFYDFDPSTRKITITNFASYKIMNWQ